MKAYAAIALLTGTLFSPSVALGQAKRQPASGSATSTASLNDPDWKEVMKASARFEASALKESRNVVQSRLADLQAALTIYRRGDPKREKERRVQLINEALIEFTIATIAGIGDGSTDESLVYDSQWKELGVEDLSEDDIEVKCDETEGPMPFVTFGAIRFAHVRRTLRLLQLAGGEKSKATKPLDVNGARASCRAKAKTYCSSHMNLVHCQQFKTDPH